ncbi:MAG: malectin domain-containing carbohydrate-binding protein [Nibricoccus sp.]
MNINLAKHPRVGRRRTIAVWLIAVLVWTGNLAFADVFNIAPRTSTALTNEWRTTLVQPETQNLTAFEKKDFDDSAWMVVSVPHNHDSYQGYRQLRHGNLHGIALYRRTFDVPLDQRGRQVFLLFEGVGSYATVWVNGQKVGGHAGGLTSFTLDITNAVVFGQPNVVAVRAEHPAGIRDLPWVCGGCERAYGFSEGPQPFGIFRPVHVVTTAPVRIAPFGVHAWIDGPQRDVVKLRVDTTLSNASGKSAALVLKTRLIDPTGRTVAEDQFSCGLSTSAQTGSTIARTLPPVSSPHLWSPADPYLYTLVTELVSDGKVIDCTQTPFGFRWISWPKTTNPDRRRLLVNGQPFFINGTADYEHLLGNNFAFTDTQIDARVHQIESAGFNAFRDAHHPHNLRFQQSWDKDGLLWWTQFGAHVWFDNDAFRTNFKKLLAEWIIERRNSPSLILWGLQNESQLPKDFAEECSALIRELDPTASSQRLITTCNGGTGVDWDVTQIWSGTYSTARPPEEYDEDLRTYSLIGEYGAWRSLDLHTEGGFVFKAPLSEDRFCALMEMKIRCAEKARPDTCGHFQWPFTSHANPGRNFGEFGEQLYDGIRPLDRIGPVNNKGLFTIWGEPTDGYYLYRANFAPKETQPMVYIVSHTWPDRWTTPGKKSGLVVYSNCDEVELFNGHRSLGKRTQSGRSTHFQWDDVEIDCNFLRAEARVGGKIVATDQIHLNHLAAFPILKNIVPDLLTPLAGQHYLYRVNCGGPAYTDSHGNHWLADRELAPDDSWGASSWSSEFENLPANFASQRKIHHPITNTADEPLFQTFRYGREELNYWFGLPDGEYQVELFFTEPWYGTGGGLNCAGWRVFDVAINDETLLQNLDIWKEVGVGRALKKVVSAKSQNGVLLISFPNIQAGQAVISAIAISSNTSQNAPKLPSALVELIDTTNGATVETHLDTGVQHFSNRPGAFTQLPYDLLEADWIRTKAEPISHLQFSVHRNADVWLAIDERITKKPAWLSEWERTSLTLASNAVPGATYIIYRKPFLANDSVKLELNGFELPPTVFVTRALPPAAPQFVELSDGTTEWIAVGSLKSGIRNETLGQTISGFPENLTGGDLIMPTTETAQSTGLAFSATDHIEIVGAFPGDSKASGDWIETKQTASIGGGVPLVLRRMRVVAGTKVSFPPGEQTPTLAFVRAVRASATYKVEKIASDTFTWLIQVGVGDRYGLNFRYRNAGIAPVNALLEIVQPNGSVLRSDNVEFPGGAPANDWKVFRTRTGASINAGTYTLRLKLPASASLELDTLEVE